MPSSELSSSPSPPDSLPANMTKGKPKYGMCLQRLKSSFRYLFILFVVLFVGYVSIEYFEISPYNLKVMSHDRSEAYRVKILPASASDEELNKLPKESFSFIAMIDAGSSGCRAHVYRYGKMGSLQGPLYLLPQHNSKKIKPGLSSFANNAQAAGTSLTDLVAFLKTEVPEVDWEVTPIYLKATAGLRMLPTNTSTAILQSVRAFLMDKKNSPFLFRESYAQIIPGNEEGGFGWLAFNYLKQIIGPRAPKDAKAIPYAVIEMGGASAQVSQLAPSEEMAKKIPAPYRFSFSIEGESYSLYTHSYLGYGAEQAREKYNSLVKQKEEMCYNEGYPGAEKRARRRLQAPPANATVPLRPPASVAPAAPVAPVAPETPVAPASAAVVSAVKKIFSSCVKNMGQLFKSGGSSSPTCPHPTPHSFSCVHQPDFVVQSVNILAFENFFYVSSALGVKGMDKGGATVFPLQTTPQLLLNATQKFCDLDWKTIEQDYPKDNQPKDVNEKVCFLGSYAYSFLVEGLRFSPNKVITIQKEVQGSEIEWALGAAYKEAASFLKRTNLRPT